MSQRERHFLEAFLEGTEAVADFIVENEAIAAVPVVSTVLKLVKGLDDLRSKILKAKLYKFLTEPSVLRSVNAGRIRSRLDKDEQRHAIGEALFLTLDKMTDLKKPELLGRAFAAYLDEVIDSETLLVLAHAIDSAFVGDLEYFLTHHAPEGQEGNPSAYRLLPAGLVDYSNFKDTPLGVALRTVAAHTHPT